jgi:lipopolysaccharide/colanic/teichoic acid biosynthesis glycosyltransferase
MKKNFYTHFIKHIFDFSFSFLSLIFLLPVFISIGIVVKIKLGSPIIFIQKRPGLNEKIFNLYKFRSMTDKRDIYGNLLSDELRLSKFGQFLRSTSLDELPSLINILKGDMSIIGPRPLLVKYLPLYNEFQKQRHLVKPGLTGLAQINGRNSIDWQEKFKYDISYINNVSFLLDLKIFIITIFKVITRKNVSSRTFITMDEFKGQK